jgi:FixJ family two-component response regulator
MSEPSGVVLVVDDDASVREALHDLLDAVGLEVRLYGSVAAFLAAPPPDAPCCLVLDVRLPGKGGLDLQAELAREREPPPIVFITGHGDIPMSVRAMKLGAVEFLTKPFREQDLLDAINQGLEQDRRRREAATLERALRARLDSLTQRERQVLVRVAAGKPNKHVANELGVTETTVKVHRGQVMRKLDATSVADLVRIVDRLRLSA